MPIYQNRFRKNIIVISREEGRYCYVRGSFKTISKENILLEFFFSIKKPPIKQEATIKAGLQKVCF